MSKAILTVKEKNSGNNAGPKAKLDVEKILGDSGFFKINFVINQRSKLQKLFISTIKIPNYFKQHHFDEIILQYPTYSEIVTKSLFNNLQKYDIKLFLFIHDVESLRLHSGSNDYIKKEINLFNETCGLVVHNEKMKKWLLDHGVNVPMVSLEIFDYLMPEVHETSSAFDRSISFAGNLAKSRFLNKIQLKTSTLNLFGPNPQKYYGHGVVYKGQYTPEELPQHLNYNFGLVWDGNSTDKCDGIFGSYLKYNDPHKVSLYLASGLPIIIWGKAALADFVVTNGLGIAVNSLDNLELKVSKISFQQYNKMKSNVHSLRGKLLDGYFTKRAISRIERATNRENIDE